jgi:hypothetical protein
MNKNGSKIGPKWVLVPTRPATYLGLKIRPRLSCIGLKINIEDINKRNDPYQLFIDNIKNKETLRKYQNLLYRFLKSIPDEIYEKNLCKSRDTFL